MDDSRVVLLFPLLRLFKGFKLLKRVVGVAVSVVVVVVVVDAAVAAIVSVNKRRKKMRLVQSRCHHCEPSRAEPVFVAWRQFLSSKPDGKCQCLSVTSFWRRFFLIQTPLFLLF